MTAPERFDIVVAGSGFAGSIMALILKNQGFKVSLVEKGQHPRFAIGESSTPVADLLLRQIAAEHNLPWLKDFSRYGSWQATHPEIVCGLKRGFSFFKHEPGKAFTTDADHINELLVAASVDNVQSDTNWLRADFDAFVAGKAAETGVVYYEKTAITAAVWNGSYWKIEASQTDGNIDFEASFIIDATGSGSLSEQLFGVKSSANDFLTHSIAVFSHFENVPRWTAWLEQRGIATDDFPFDPDHSALHQVLDEGWMWMLRFNDRRTSLGFVLDVSEQSYDEMTAEELWRNKLESYPSLKKLLDNLSLSPQPGAIIKSGRLQRRMERSFGPGWVALPNTVGFVDPLFSPGIAHSLSGVQKIARLIKENWKVPKSLDEGLQQYEQDVIKELKLIDQLIAGCYQTMRCFPLFNAWSMLYFAATIAHEQNLISGQPAGCFLSADDEYVIAIVNESYPEMVALMAQKDISDSDIERFTDAIRQRIKPLNTARLLDTSLKNMYTHTAARI